MERTCKFCGTPLDSSNPKRQYCNDTCRGRACQLRLAKQAGTYPPSPDLTLQERIAEIRATLDPLPAPPPKVLVNVDDEDALGFGPQVQVALFSDYHRGEVVDPRETGGIGNYNTAVARERFTRWRDGVLRFRQTYRFPISKLYIPGLGDDIEGHGQIYPAQAFYMDTNLQEQVVGFVADMEDALRLFCQVYPEVEVFHVPGNHGRGSNKRNERPFMDNIENIMWMWLRDRLADLPNLTIRVEPAFFILVDILGWTFYFSHGDDVLPMSPYAKRGGQNTKLRMNAVTGEHINYMCIGHSHTNIELEPEINGRLMVNGAFSGPSMLSVQGMHEANLPSQLIFAVHPKWGITHRTNLTLATAEEIRNVNVFGR